MPPDPKPITIAGGGLAGLTLGILLQRGGVPTTIYEAGNYPRHKVCGEFISGRGVSILQQLEVLKAEHPFLFVQQADFFSESRKIASWKLPEPALGISRFSLDLLLAECFRGAGGRLVTDHRVTGEATEGKEGFVLATGRNIQVNPNAWRYVGLKAHAWIPDSIEHLQIHFRENGYVGVSPLPNGSVNVCGLFRFKGVVQHLKADWQKVLCGPKGTALWSLLEGAEFLSESFSAVAGLHFGKDSQKRETVNLGDRYGMIAPLTGNGMSIAFETAELSFPWIRDYALGKIGWMEVVFNVNVAFKKLLHRRLGIARNLQRFLLQKSGRKVIFPMFEYFPAWINQAYHWTHS